MGIDSRTIPPRMLKLMGEQRRAALGRDGLLPEEREAEAEVASERELQQDICQFLNLRGIPFDRDSMAHRRRGTRGWPDFSFPFRGRFVGLECKVGRGEPTPEQAQVLAQIEAQGGVARVVRSVAEVKALLDTVWPF